MTIKAKCTGFCVEDTNGNTVAMVYDSVGEDKAKEIAKAIEKMIAPKYDIHIIVSTSPNKLNVVVSGMGTIEIYWEKQDQWRYGISTKEKAQELADFLKDNMDVILNDCTFPNPKNAIIKTNGEYLVFKDGHIFAKVPNTSALNYWDKDEFFIPSLDLNSMGLRSHSSKWDRSIRIEPYGSELRKEIKSIIYHCMSFMEANWGVVD